MLRVFLANRNVDPLTPGEKVTRRGNYMVYVGLSEVIYRDLDPLIMQCLVLELMEK